MNLGFTLHNSVEQIESGEKIHTLRIDKFNRWRAGLTIHFCTGLRTPQYSQFKIGECVSTQSIEFLWSQESKVQGNEWWEVRVLIDGNDVTLNRELINTLAKNDGFPDVDAFFAWKSWNKKDFKGKIIHFTNFRY